MSFQLNCDPSLGDPNAKKPEKCPHCRQFHLVAGYCQALPKIGTAPKRFIAPGPDGEARRRRYARKFGVLIDVATGKPFDPPLEEGEAHLGLGDAPAVPDMVKAAMLAPPRDAKPEVSVTDSVTRDAKGTLTKCRECSKEFEPQRATAKFCSSRCRKRAARKRAE